MQKFLFIFVRKYYQKYYYIMVLYLSIVLVLIGAIKKSPKALLCELN